MLETKIKETIKHNDSEENLRILRKVEELGLERGHSYMEGYSDAFLYLTNKLKNGKNI